MDHSAALHRIKVGVPATVEHSSEAGPETGKLIAETTQVGAAPLISAVTDIEITSIELYYVYGCPTSPYACKGPVTSYAARIGDWIRKIQGQQGLGRPQQDDFVVCSSPLAEICLISLGHPRRLITLNGMKASEELTEEQARQVRHPVFTSIKRLFSTRCS
jgi:ESCRT-I complex subunit VPS28